MTTFNDVEAKRRGVVYKPMVIINACGTAVGWNIGYPFDLAQALVDAGLPYINQPIYYGPGGVPNAFPMETSINTGVVEGLRLIRQVWTSYDIVLSGYSQGALVIRQIWDQLTAEERSRVKAIVRFGPPDRKAGHTFPGGIDPGGRGIVLPNWDDCPDICWDFACGKAFGNSPGQDFYATAGYDGNAESFTDEEAVWEIVYHGTIKSAKSLGVAVFNVIKSPLKNAWAAVNAVLDSGLFFVVEGIVPHTSYGTCQPIAGDQRDCFRVAFDYLYSVGVAYSGRAA
jgi:hypothetical protein